MKNSRAQKNYINYASKLIIFVIAVSIYIYLLIIISFV